MDLVLLFVGLLDLLVCFACCFVINSEQLWDFSYSVFPWMRGLGAQARAAHAQRRGIYLCAI